MKKETIRIFFACSNSFSDSNEKDNIKSFLEALNKKYDNNRQDLTVKYEWCDSLENDDSLFKKISRHNADIVVYLIGENIESSKNEREKLIEDLKKVYETGNVRFCYTFRKLLNQ